MKTVAEARAELGLGRGSGVAKFNPYHDEQGRFTTAEGAVEPGEAEARKPDLEAPALTEGRAAAEDPPLLPSRGGKDKYSVQLADEERYWGGHGVKDHVGVSRDALKSEIAESAVTTMEGGVKSTEYKVNGEGSYDSVDSANDITNRILEQRKSEVDAVANGAIPDTFLNERFGYPTGYEAIVAENGEIVIRPTYSAGVYIVHDDRVPRGYRVDTTYPNNKPSNAN